jgi:hypothetical protein
VTDERKLLLAVARFDGDPSPRTPVGDCRADDDSGAPSAGVPLGVQPCNRRVCRGVMSRRGYRSDGPSDSGIAVLSGSIRICAVADAPPCRGDLRISPGSPRFRIHGILHGGFRRYCVGALRRSDVGTPGRNSGFDRLSVEGSLTEEPSGASNGFRLHTSDIGIRWIAARQTDVLWGRGPTPGYRRPNRTTA